jgi:hypothetical protein
MDPRGVGENSDDSFNLGASTLGMGTDRPGIHLGFRKLAVRCCSAPVAYVRAFRHADEMRFDLKILVSVGVAKA